MATELDRFLGAGKSSATSVAIVTLPSYNSPTLDTFLSKGYFPRELPPPFNTVVFAAYAVGVGGTWSKKGWTRCVSHNLARPGGLRRPLKIPNPVPYFVLSDLMVSNWAALRSHTWKTRLSASRPQVIKASDRAVVARYRYREVPRLRALRRRGARYVLCTDIDRFYPTIYTHSVAWALHSKATVKAALITPSKGNNLLGNKLDKVLMWMNDGQTLGIPIGPDASLVISEVLLAAIDDVLKQRLPTLSGYRYIDDYELSFASLKEAEAALVELQNILATYELQVNPRKTAIDELPKPLDGAWAHELGQFVIRGTSPVKQRNDILALFSRAFEIAESTREKPVLRYAVLRVQGLTVPQVGWRTLENCLLGAVGVEPETMAAVFGTLFKVSSRSGQAIAKAPLKQTLEAVIATHAPLAHGSEVAWALWGALAWNLSLTAETAKSLSGMDDDIVALLALDASSRLLFPAGALDTTQWAATVGHPEVLNSEHWLLAYEANLKGWLPAPAVAAHPVFGPMNHAGVSFYDQAMNRPHYPSAAGAIPGGTLPDFYA